MKTWLKGGIIGLVVSVILLLNIMILSFDEAEKFRLKEFYYERFKLCEPCGMPRDLDCVMEKCEFEYSTNSPTGVSQEEYQKMMCSEHPDIKRGPESFINDFCGYEGKKGLNYGTKPSRRIGPYLRLPSTTEIFILLLPIIFGALIGLIIQKVRKK